MARRVPTSLLWLVVCTGLLGVSLSGSAAWADPPKISRDDDYELYKILVDTMDQVERNYVKEIDRRELVEAAIQGVLTKLDPYSSYIPPEELNRFRSTVENQFGGIGIQITMDEGQLKILSPLVGTPAYRAGLLAGDRIVEINGKPTAGVTLDEAVRRLKGKEGTQVTLVVIKPDKTSKEEVTITREIIHVETVLGDRHKLDDTWDFMLDPERHIGYIRITAFGRDTARDLRKALEELQKEDVQGLVLDMRFNPGGLLNAAIEVSDLFISKGRIVSTKGRNSPERTWDAQKEGTFEGFPIVILVNRYSASAAEIVSACLQDHHRAVIMGERSWGKGSVQNVIELEEGHSALKLTTAGYCRPSGKNIHRFPDAKESDEWGVMPDQGYELKLSDSELGELVQYRRQRDILLPHPIQQAVKEQKTPATSAPEGPAKEEKEANRTNQQSTAPASKEPVEGASKSPAVEPNGSAGTPTAGDAEGTFVDRQLEMAIKYLTGGMVGAG